MLQILLVTVSGVTGSYDIQISSIIAANLAAMISTPE